MGERCKRSNRHSKFETTQLRGGQEQPDPSTGARSVPIYQTLSYVSNNCDHAAARFNLSDPGNIYSRSTNPTLDVFKRRMAQLEGGVAALATASGAAALFYIFQNLTRAGDHIVSSGYIYDGTYNYLTHTFPECGVETTFVDPADLEAAEAAIRDNTKAVSIEIPGNPNSDIADTEKIASIARRHQILLVVDSTFVTPYPVRPIEYGADIMVYSTTKFIGGHGTAVGGMIVDDGRFDWVASKKFPGFSGLNASYHGIRFAQDTGAAAFVTRVRVILLRSTGATLSPFHGFLFLQGLETLFLRVECHMENAPKVVEYLSAHPQVETVHRPSVSRDPIQQQLYKTYFPRGGGSIFTFEIRGGAENARRFIDNLELFSLLANVVDVESLVIHSASTTHLQTHEKELLEQGIRPGTIWLSIGTEYADDILEDLEEAFRSVQHSGSFCTPVHFVLRSVQQRRFRLNPWVRPGLRAGKKSTGERQ